MKTIALTFEGPYTNKEYVPSNSGVYCVYACIHSKATSMVTYKRLLYVGESTDVKTRIDDHERLDDWMAHLRQGEKLCYTFAGVTSPDRKRAEAAIIHKYAPPVNEHKYALLSYKTEMKISGRKGLLASTFTVGNSI